MTASTIKMFEEAGVEMQSAHDVALAVAYLAQEEEFNGACIACTQGRYRELESILNAEKARIYGEDDFEPQADKAVAAMLAVMETVW